MHSGNTQQFGVRFPLVRPGSSRTWTNVTYAETINASYARVDATPATSGYSDWLVMLPSWAEAPVPANGAVTGVAFSLMGYTYETNFGAGRVKDSALRLVTNYNDLGIVDLASPDNWVTANNWMSRAGSSELWDGDLLAATVNTAGFGFALSVNMQPTTNQTLSALLDGADCSIYWVEMSGDPIYTVISDVAAVDIAEVTTDDEAVPITGASIDWGDGTTSATEEGYATHRYTQTGTYTVTSTVTLAGGGIYPFTTEVNIMAAATITKVSPLAARRVSESITITGTNFEASQSTGSVTIGGQAATISTWSDTSIVCKAAANAALGVSDVTVTPAANTAATATDAIYILSDVIGKSAADIDIAQIDTVFFKGLDLGHIEGALELLYNQSTVEMTPGDSFDPLKIWSFTGVNGCRFTLAQVYDGTIFAECIGGSYDAINNTVTLSYGSENASGLLVIKEKAGSIHVFPVSILVSTGALSLNKAAGGIQVEFRAMPDENNVKYKAQLP